MDEHVASDRDNVAVCEVSVGDMNNCESALGEGAGVSSKVGRGKQSSIRPTVTTTTITIIFIQNHHIQNHQWTRTKVRVLSQGV